MASKGRSSSIEMYDAITTKINEILNDAVFNSEVLDCDEVESLISWLQDKVDKIQEDYDDNCNEE